MRRARDIMTHPVIIVSPTTPVTEVARVLVENGISGCPVVDHTCRVRGIISKSNLIDFAMKSDDWAVTPVLRILNPGAGGMEMEEVIAPPEVDLEIPMAEDIMSAEPVTVSMDLPLAEVAALLARESIHRVPVMKGEELVGIITSLDLLRAFPADKRAR